MDTALKNLAAQYYKRYGRRVRSKRKLSRLYQNYTSERQADMSGADSLSPRMMQAINKRDKRRSVLWYAFESIVEQFMKRHLLSFRFALIGATEGTKFLMRRQSLQEAASHTLGRSLKTGSVTALAVLLSRIGVGTISLPASWLLEWRLPVIRLLKPYLSD
jgi:hypothetical protein